MNEITQTRITEINNLHETITAGLKATLYKAVELGGMLKKTKESLPHGGFTSWVDDNLVFNIRTAQRYMKANDNRERIENDSGVVYLNQLIDVKEKQKTIFEKMDKEDVLCFTQDLLNRVNRAYETRKGLFNDDVSPEEIEQIDTRTPNGFMDRVTKLIAEVNDFDWLVKMEQTMSGLTAGYSVLNMQNMTMSVKVKEAIQALMPRLSDEYIYDHTSELIQLCNERIAEIEKDV